MPATDPTSPSFELVELQLDDPRIDQVLEALAPTCLCPACNPLGLPAPTDYSKQQARAGSIVLLIALVRFTAAMEHHTNVRPGEMEAAAKLLLPVLFRELLPEYAREVAAREAASAQKH